MRRCVGALAHDSLRRAVDRHDVAGVANGLAAALLAHAPVLTNCPPTADFTAPYDTISFTACVAPLIGPRVGLLSRALNGASLLAAELCGALARALARGVRPAAPTALARWSVDVLVAASPAAHAALGAHQALCAALFNGSNADAPGSALLGCDPSAWLPVLCSAHDPWLAAAAVRAVPLEGALSAARSMRALPAACAAALKDDPRLQGAAAPVQSPPRGADGASARAGGGASAPLTSEATPPRG